MSKRSKRTTRAADRPAAVAPRSQPAAPAARPWALWLGAIAVAAFALRLIVLIELRHTPFFEILVGDGREYDRWAQEIAGGQWIGAGAFYQSPLYPYLLAVVYAIVGHHVFLIRVLQAMLGAGSCALLGVAGRRFFTPAAGLIAAGLLAIYPPAIFFDGLIQKSSLDVALMAALLLLCGGLLTARRGPALFGIGVVLGLLTLNRENARVLIPLVALWVAWLCRDTAWPARAKANVVVLAGAWLAVVPVMIRNGVVSGEWLISTSQFGSNFYIGNHNGASGTYDALVPGHGDPRYERADATRLAEAAVGHPLTASGVSDFWLDRALADIRSDVGGWLALTSRKFGLALHAREIVDTESIDAFATRSPVLDGLKWFGFGWILPLGVFGAWLTRRDWRRLGILYLIFGALLASTAIFYVVARYRLPLVPPVLLFAAAGLDALRRPRALARVDLASGIAAALVTALLIHLPAAAVRPGQDSTYFNYGQAAVDQGDLSEAILLLERAVAISPDPTASLTVLGAAYQREHDTTHAIETLTEAVRRRPSSAYAQYDLGLALNEAGRSAEAADHLAAAVKADPSSAGYHADFGVVLDRLGRHDEAIAEFRASLQIDSKNADVHDKLGVALAGQGRLPEAMQEFRFAVSAAPDSVDAHTNLALALALAGHFDEAASHYETARRLAPSSITVALNYGLLLAREGRIADARSMLDTAAILARGQNRADLLPSIEAAVRSLPR